MSKKAVSAPSDPLFNPEDFNKVPTDTDGIKALLGQHMDSATLPEQDLIPLFYQLEKSQPEVAQYLDQAIELLSKARSAMSLARMRLK